MLSYLMQAIEVKNSNTPALARNVAAKRLDDHHRADDRRFDELLTKTESVARVSERQAELAADDARFREDTGQDSPQSESTVPPEKMDSEGFLNYLMANAGVIESPSSKAAAGGSASASVPTPTTANGAAEAPAEGYGVNALVADGKQNIPSVNVTSVMRFSAISAGGATDNSAEPAVRPLSGLGSIKEPSARPLSAANPNALVAKSDELLNRPMKLDYAGSELFDKIQMMTRGSLQHAVIRLDPPELGALEVRILVHQDQTQVQIVSSSSVVRDLLEQQSTRLRESLAGQGMELANLEVQDPSSQGQGGSSSRGGMDEMPNDAGLDGVGSPVVEVIQSLSLIDHYV